MRKNVKQVFEAWKNGNPKSGTSISTDGTTIYSYRTPIVERRHDGGVDVNVSHYSSTTSCQQGSLRAALTMSGIAYNEVER